MYWLAVALGIALLAMLLTRGSVVRLFGLPIQSLWLLIVGLGIQVALWLVDVPSDRVDDLGFGLLMLSYALVLAFCFVNIRVRGMAIVAIGFAMNAVVTGLNEGMPTRDEEVETRAGRTVERPVEHTATERPESDDDLLPFLGQIIRLPENRVDEALAPGDIVIAAGILVVFVAGSRRRRERAAVEEPLETIAEEAVEEGEGIEEVQVEAPVATADAEPAAETIEAEEPEEEEILVAEAVEIPDETVVVDQEARQEEAMPVAAPEPAPEPPPPPEPVPPPEPEPTPEPLPPPPPEPTPPPEPPPPPPEPVPPPEPTPPPEPPAPEPPPPPPEPVPPPEPTPPPAPVPPPEPPPLPPPPPEPPPPPPEPPPLPPEPVPPPPAQPAEPAPARQGADAEEWETWQAELRALTGDLEEEREAGDDTAT